MSSVSAAAQSSSSAPSDVLTARRTESHDIAAIIRLITYVTKNVFGRINVTYLLETANLAVTLINQKNEAVAHALFLDYPNWNFVDPAHWENFLQDHYHESKCTPLNTLFLHLFVAAERAAHCSREIIRAVFRTVPELHFILLIIPSQENLGMDLAAAFKPLMKVSDEDVTMEYRLFMCERYWFCAQLFIRQARVEDHDDLTPLFTSQNDTLIETYGEYVLAELIEAQDDENVAVVCEDEGKAVGFMSVCSEVNIQLLHDCFDLGPFHGLCKPHPDDVLQLPQEPDSTAEVSSIPRRERSESTDTHDTETQGIKSETSECTVSVPPSVVESGLSKEAEAEPALPVPSLEQLLDSAQEEALKPSEAPSVEREAFRPIYRGAVNAFCIQLFCIDERYETRSLDFLNFVFKLFPILQFIDSQPSVPFISPVSIKEPVCFTIAVFRCDRDFCIITVPHMVPEFYLIQNFVRVIPFSSCTLDQELYMFHRSGLLKSFIVRSAKSNDIQAVEVLIKTLDLNRSMLDDLNNYTLARRDLDGTPVQAFVAEVLKQIVGIAIIRNEMDVEYIRSHYNVEDFIYFNHHQREDHGHLYHFALNPIFHHYAKHFMKEILRRSYKTCLYYPIHPQTAKGKFQNPCAHSLTSALHYMVPVRPRRQIVYPLEKLGINAPSKQVSKDQAKYALNHFNRKLSLEPKVSVNARIVVIGASNVGISFLETLIFCPHLKFNNLTLISTHGLPGKCMLEKQHKHFLINSHCFNDDDYALMSLCSWVNVVVGKMTGIDRCAKHVTVSEGGKVPYDHLILCTGQQYQVPCATGADIRKLPTNREVIQNRQQRYTGVVPSNLFILSDEEDCLLAMKWAKENLIGVSENVIVYGNTIDVFTTVEALVSLGISGSRIHLVQPPRQSNVTAINDNAIEKAVDKALSKAGVSVHLDSLLAQWNDGSHPDPIVQASFTTKTKAFRLQCSAFFNFTHKRVDYDTFKAVNDACLVYDGKLVIDTNFHTNDVAIRAAGPLTKFSNMYYANEWTHSNFNSKEVGFQLAAAMLNLFDPTLEPVFEPPEDMDRLIPMYKGCKVEAGILPGKYYYLHIYKPGIPTRLDVQETQPSYGMAIKTGNAIKGNYFRIHINQYSLIETITCFSKNPLPVSNYIPLFGQHERLLNNLCSRWKEGLVTDLYSYLKEPWALVIFHDRFIDLKKELREILASIQEENHPSMQGLVQQVVEGELTLLERPKTYLKRFYKQTVYRNLLEKSILSYLNYNNYHLPMFAWPGIV